MSYLPSLFNDDVFEDPFDDLFFAPVRSNRNLLKTDIKEVGDHYEVAINVPGAKKEDIKIGLKDGYLTVSASVNHNNDEKDKEGHYIRRERYSGTASRNFYVGEKVKKEDIHASYDGGVLKLTVPKQEVQKEVEEDPFIAIE